MGGYPNCQCCTRNQPNEIWTALANTVTVIKLQKPSSWKKVLAIDQKFVLDTPACSQAHSACSRNYSAEHQGLQECNAAHIFHGLSSITSGPPAFLAKLCLGT